MTDDIRCCTPLRLCLEVFTISWESLFNQLTKGNVQFGLMNHLKNRCCFKHLSHESRDSSQLAISCPYPCKDTVPHSNFCRVTRHKASNLCHQHVDTNLQIQAPQISLLSMLCSDPIQVLSIMSWLIAVKILDNTQEDLISHQCQRALRKPQSSVEKIQASALSSW